MVLELRVDKQGAVAVTENNTRVGLGSSMASTGVQADNRVAYWNTHFGDLLKARPEMSQKLYCTIL